MHKSKPHLDGVSRARALKVKGSDEIGRATVRKMPSVDA